LAKLLSFQENFDTSWLNIYFFTKPFYYFLAKLLPFHIETFFNFLTKPSPIGKISPIFG